MWGNYLGWMISGVIAIGTIGLLAFYARGASTISPPTRFGMEAADGGVAIAVPAESVIGASKPCDAAQPYSEAIALYRREPELYDDVAAGLSRPPADDSQLPAVQRLIEGTHCRDMSLFTGEPGRIVRYGDSPDIEALHRVGKVAVRVGLGRQAAKRDADAIRCYEAAFALGAKLYDERMTYREMMAGMELMGEAGVALSRLTFAAGDTTRTEAAQKFDAARRSAFTAHVQPVAQKLISIDRDVVGQHVGDVFHLAAHAAERVWRVEAILALGRMRYFVGDRGRRGDQRGANHHLQRHALDKDPVIRAAAKAAMELTREQMRMLK